MKTESHDRASIHQPHDKLVKRLLNENKTLGRAELIEWVHQMTGLPVKKLTTLLVAQN